MDCHDFMYIAKVRVRGEREQHFLVVSPGLSHSELATQTGNLCELCLSVNHFDCCCCCCWWHAHAANHSTQSSVAQRSAAQRSTGTHTLTPAAAAAATARSLLPAAVFAARSPSTNFHIVCLQLWAHQSNSTLFIRVCADKQTNSTQCTYRNTYLCIVHIIKKSSWLS